MLLQHSYQSLPSIFFASQNPETVENPECVLYNSDLVKELWIEEFFPAENTHNLLSGNVLPEWAQPLAQAYMGHQFGYPNMLGDGRALLLGEHKNPEWKLVDIALKGSGRTQFSRWGDGKASLKAMLREYLMSEAMHGLWVPTSRSLAVVKSGEKVVRNEYEDGAILTRIMSSHIRVGTFEFAKQFGTKGDMQALIDYTIQRHYPELSMRENTALWLLETVIDKQLDLVTDWLRVGFIHGVMNTDNTSICWETFDYGPCAFMGSFDPQRVFSSIDEQGRYAYQNQTNIILWNLSVFAETLSGFIDSEKIYQTLSSMWEAMHSKWLTMMSQKLGIQNPLSNDEPLIKELLSWMQDNEADYTNTFLYIGWNKDIPDSDVYDDKRFTAWLEVWKKRVRDVVSAQEYMKKHNPLYIPRNHIVEKVLDEAVWWDYESFHTFLKLLKQPYSKQKNSEIFMRHDVDFEKSYMTFCGT